MCYGEIMKEIRDGYGFTQKELAIYLEVNIRTIQNWESRGCSKTVYKLLHRCYWSDRARLGEDFDNDDKFKKYMRKQLELIKNFFPDKCEIS